MSGSKPHRRVILNGRLLDAEEAAISPLGGGLMFGVGLFETIKVLKGEPVFFADHFERLCRSAPKLSINWVTEGDKLHARSRQLIAANEIEEAALKIVVFQENEGAGELILTRPLAYSAAAYERGFKLKTFLDRRPTESLDALKTLNYLKNLQARQAAHAAGFDEALFIDESGPLLEGSTSNIFMVKNGEVWTPPLGRILPGVARAQILLAQNGAKANEHPISRQMLCEADEVFLTNSLLGVMPVASIDAQSYGLQGNSVTRRLMDAYRRWEFQSVDDGRRDLPARTARR